MPIDFVIETIQSNMDADGIIIEGFPRTMQQVEHYNKYVSVLNCFISYWSEHRLVIHRYFIPYINK